MIYIDPPFATNSDFSVVAQLGESGIDLEKEASIIEETAYRDTWGSGIESYLDMLLPRILVLRDLLSSDGNLFLHIGPNLSHYVRTL